MLLFQLFGLYLTSTDYKNEEKNVPDVAFAFYRVMCLSTMVKDNMWSALSAVLSLSSVCGKKLVAKESLCCTNV